MNECQSRAADVKYRQLRTQDVNEVLMFRGESNYLSVNYSHFFFFFYSSHLSNAVAETRIKNSLKTTQDCYKLLRGGRAGLIFLI